MRKIWAGFLAALVLSLLFPARALAYSNVDLSRVEFSSGEEPLVFSFGSVKINGELRQAFPFTEAEIEKLVKEALEESGLTELDIKEANAKVEKARRASTFTKEDIARIKKNLLTTMETVPATENLATLLETIDKYMTSKSWDDIGTASATMLEKSMTEKVKETAGGFLNSAGEMGKNVDMAEKWVKSLDSIVKFCDMLADEQAHTRQKWKDIADGANAKRLLNKFYEKLQDKIDRYKEKSDQGGWIIDFDHAMAGRNFTFFGVDSNYQTWTLDMRIKQKTTNEYGSVVGEYEGFYTIVAEHDMSSFQSRSDEVLRYLNKKTALGAGLTVFIDGMRAGGFPTDFKPTAPGTAYISRTISGKCEATIEESAEITLNLHQDSDETMVDISGVTAVLLSTIQQAGVNAEMIIDFELLASEEDLNVKVSPQSISGVAGGYGFSVPGSAKSGLTGLGGQSGSGWEESIWIPWNGTDKLLKFSD